MDINIKNVNISTGELATLMLIRDAQYAGKKTVNRYLQDMTRSLEKRGMLAIIDGRPIMAKTTENMLNKAIQVQQKRNFNALAKKMYELFPRGQKPGTAYSWRYPIVSIERRLEKLIDETKQDFTDEEAVAATEAYVKSFGSDRAFMRLLKYFICKEKDKGEPESDLLMWIEKIRGGEEDIVTAVSTSDRDLL